MLLLRLGAEVEFSDTVDSGDDGVVRGGDQRGSWRDDGELISEWSSFRYLGWLADRVGSLCCQREAPA